MNVIGTDGLTLVHPGDRELARNRITVGSEEPYELRLLCNDNSIKFVEVHAQMMLINGERLRVTAFRDITERNKAEKTLRELSSRYEAILSAVPDIIVEVNCNKVYSVFNMLFNRI